MKEHTNLSVPRIETLGDGVFAIAMTLLVLELKVPDTSTISSSNDLWIYLGKHYVSFSSFFLSFLSLGIVWVSHHTQFSYIEKVSRELTWVNVFLYLFVTLFPFTTSLISRFPDLKAAAILYWLNNLGGITLLYYNWKCVIKHGYHAKNKKALLVTKMLDIRLRKAVILFSLGFLVCLVTSSKLSLFLIVAIDMIFILPTKLDKGLRDLLKS